MKLLKDYKVIAEEDVANQHSLVIGGFKIRCPKESKEVYVPLRKTWKLENKHIRSDFETQFRQCVPSAEIGIVMEEKLTRLKERYHLASEKTCRWTKGPPKRKVHW